MEKNHTVLGLATRKLRLPPLQGHHQYRLDHWTWATQRFSQLGEVGKVRGQVAATHDRERGRKNCSARRRAAFPAQRQRKFRKSTLSFTDIDEGCTQDHHYDLVREKLLLAPYLLIDLCATFPDRPLIVGFKACHALGGRNAATAGEPLASR